MHDLRLLLVNLTSMLTKTKAKVRESFIHKKGFTVTEINQIISLCDDYHSL